MIKLILLAGFLYSVGLVMAAFLWSLVGRINKEQEKHEQS